MSVTDLIVSSTENFNIITLDHMMMKKALVGDTGHFHNVIDLAGSEGLQANKIDDGSFSKMFRFCIRSGWSCQGRRYCYSTSFREPGSDAA